MYASSSVCSPPLLLLLHGGVGLWTVTWVERRRSPSDAGATRSTVGALSRLSQRRGGRSLRRPWRQTRPLATATGGHSADRPSAQAPRLLATYTVRPPTDLSATHSGLTSNRTESIDSGERVGEWVALTMGEVQRWCVHLSTDAHSARRRTAPRRVPSANVEQSPLSSSTSSSSSVSTRRGSLESTDRPVAHTDSWNAPPPHSNWAARRCIQRGQCTQSIRSSLYNLLTTLVSLLHRYQLGLLAFYFNGNAIKL